MNNFLIKLKNVMTKNFKKEVKEQKKFNEKNKG